MKYKDILAAQYEYEKLTRRMDYLVNSFRDIKIKIHRPAEDWMVDNVVYFDHFAYELNEAVNQVFWNFKKKLQEEIDNIEV